MIDWIYVTVCAFMIPGIMILFGWWFGGHPPKKINRICGYRTRMSMKNMDTWVFAHTKCGETWLHWGKWMLLPSAIVMAAAVFLAPEQAENAGIIILLGQVVGLLLSLIPVEKSLQETFDEDGYRRK